MNREWQNELRSFLLTTFSLSGSQQRNDRGSQEAHVSKSARVTESRSVGQNAPTPPSGPDPGFRNRDTPRSAVLSFAYGTQSKENEPQAIPPGAFVHISDQRQEPGDYPGRDTSRGQHEIGRYREIPQRGRGADFPHQVRRTEVEDRDARVDRI